MNRIVKIKNLQTGSDTYVGTLIESGSYYTIENALELSRFAENDKVNQHIWSIPSKISISDGEQDFGQYDSDKWLKGNLPESVKPINTPYLAWECIKNMFDTFETSGARMYYVECPISYYIIVKFHDINMCLPILEKDTEDATDFETNYKSAKCNINEAPRVRTTTNKRGRRLHQRYVTFFTSSQDEYDNTDWEENSYGDLTYFMIGYDGSVTQDSDKCKETWIDWEPEYDYEISGGAIYVPNELESRSLNITSITKSGSYAIVVSSGSHQLKVNSMLNILDANEENYNGIKKITHVLNNTEAKYALPSGASSQATGDYSVVEADDAWEIHVVAAPDVPASYGGNIHLIANPRLKWLKGMYMVVDSSVNPAEMLYNATYHTNKIRFVVKHPVGAKTEFQLRLQLYK